LKRLMNEVLKGQVMKINTRNVGDTDPHIFGPPRSGTGSICQRYGSGSDSFPFLRKVLSGVGLK
jgi:hypothetical protein